MFEEIRETDDVKSLYPSGHAGKCKVMAVPGLALYRGFEKTDNGGSVGK